MELNNFAKTSPCPETHSSLYPRPRCLLLALLHTGFCSVQGLLGPAGRCTNGLFAGSVLLIVLPTPHRTHTRLNQHQQRLGGWSPQLLEFRARYPTRFFRIIIKRKGAPSCRSFVARRAPRAREPSLAAAYVGCSPAAAHGLSGPQPPDMWTLPDQGLNPAPYIVVDSQPLDPQGNPNPVATPCRD